MPNDEEARRAIDELNGAEVSGRTIVVNESEKREGAPRKKCTERWQIPWWRWI